MKEEQPKSEWMGLNFQMINTSRQLFFETQNTSHYKVGNNILINQFSILNRKVSLHDLNLPIESFKIKCKNMFLKNV